MISFVYPENPDGVTDEDLKRTFGGIRNNLPELLEEMRPSAEHQRLADSVLPGFGHALNAGGPILNAAMLRLGARAGLAFHFYETDHVVSVSGAVASTWRPNFVVETQGLPEDLIRLLGPARTLRQGKGFQTGGQFRYGSVVAEDGAVSAHPLVFRRSLALIAYVAEDAEMLSSLPAGFTPFRPGFLRRT